MKRLAGVLAAASEVEAYCRAQGWRFCFIGGLAVQRWGNPRFTQDVDLTIVTGYGSEEAVIDPFLERFESRMPEARQFALQNRVLLARTAGGVDLDIALGAMPFEETAVERASQWRITKKVMLTTCSAEDLVVHKVFAGRDRDWADVESVLIRQHGLLDLAIVRKELPPLLEIKSDSEAMNRFERMVSTVNDRVKR